MATTKKEQEKAESTPAPAKAAVNKYEPSEMVIKEIMIQKSVSREKAIEILQNPSK